MPIRIGINGFGRIGRLVMRLGAFRDDIEFVAVNDPFVNAEYMRYLLQYDTVHGTFPEEIKNTEHTISVSGSKIGVLAFPNPRDIPWDDLGADYVVESSGVFTSVSKASAHLEAGAKKVVITAQAPDAPTYVVGVNDSSYDPRENIVSNASCTTNCLAPLAKIIHSRFGIEEALMTTIHAATATQKTVDSPSAKDWRSGRSIFGNIIPASTGAARAVTKVIPELQGRLTGMAMRIPSANVSVVDLTARLIKPCSYGDICAEIRRRAQDEYRGIIRSISDPLVSSDLIGDTHTCIFDEKAGLALNDRFVKLIAWYDNETGYSSKVLDLISRIHSTCLQTAGV